MAIKGFEILLWFLIIPLAAGNLPVFETGKEKDWFVRMADALICGYVLLFAVFELLALPLIFTRQSFAVLKYSYEILACVLALAGVIFAWKNKKNRADGAERKKSLSRKKIPAAMWLAFLLVAIQMGAYVFGMATDLDDAFYVATATTTLETNGMFTYDAYTGMLASYLPARYVFAPFPILLAFYSDMVHMHAAVVAHTVEPVFFLLISYLVYWKIGRKLFDKDDRKVGLFLLFLVLIQMFSYYSVHSLETFGSVDGPGVRFVVFLQGCALRCKYCHNPETWAEGGEEWTVDKLFQRVWRYRNYWGKKGGITVSGGEPLRQMEFLTAFFELARSKGVHTALDTAGQPFRPDDAAYLADFDRLMKSTSLVILDLKEIDPEKHRRLTGKDNANILAMARHISDLGVPLWIRHVLVPGLTDDEDGLRKTAEFISSLKTVQRVEVLPYHTLGLFKWQKLGIPYPLPDAVPPTAEQVKRAEELLETARYTS